MTLPKVATAALLLALLAAAATTAAFPARADAAATVWAVGDGGVEGPEDDEVVDRIESMGSFDRLLYLGDVYEHGTAEEYASNYHTSFGRFKELTSPTPGNHEWGNRATGYDPYWGDLAPQNDGGRYYSFDLAGWHVVSLNSEESRWAESAQVAWLRADLRRYRGTCTLAFVHAPRYSAGDHGDRADMEPIWAELAGRSVVNLAGHEHNYQRLAPERGILPLIVGTGGRGFHEVNESDRRLRAYDDESFGALRLRLHPAGATFRFITTDGEETDSGRVGCVPHDPDAALVQVVNPLYGRSYSQSLRTFKGLATDALESRVRLTLVRSVGDSCRAFDGTRFVPASCKTTRSFPATGDSRWQYTLPAGVTLPRDSYKLKARVATGDQTVTRLVRFSVR